MGLPACVSVWFARDDWVKSHADVAQRFARAMRDTAAFVGWLDQSVSAAGVDRPDDDIE